MTFTPAQLQLLEAKGHLQALRAAATGYPEDHPRRSEIAEGIRRISNLVDSLVQANVSLPAELDEQFTEGPAAEASESPDPAAEKSAKKKK